MKKFAIISVIFTSFMLAMPCFAITAEKDQVGRAKDLVEGPKNMFIGGTTTHFLEEARRLANADGPVSTPSVAIVPVKAGTLPEYYTVRSGDCLHTIAARSYVYNDATKWPRLYQANKDNMPEPNNPDLILPGMKMKIPAQAGEYRNGIY